LEKPVNHETPKIHEMKNRIFLVRFVVQPIK
jgi:hypothetical protein